MAHISRSKATLRLIGDSLNPQEVSELLGCSGSTMYSKGDVRIVAKSGRKIIQKNGHWSLQAKEYEPENIDAQVKELLSRLTANLAVWKELSEKFSIDLFCGIFMEESNEGMEISPSTLYELGSRGILLSLDIYDGAE